MAVRRQPLLEHIHRIAARLEPQADVILLERFVRQRDSLAFETLVGRHGPMVLGVCHGKLIATLDGLLVRFWDVASGKAQSFQLPSGHEGAVKSLAFTPDGQTLISSAIDHTVRWWDTRTGRQRLNLPCQKDSFPSRRDIIVSKAITYAGNTANHKTERSWANTASTSSMPLRGRGGR